MKQSFTLVTTLVVVFGFGSQACQKKSPADPSGTVTSVVVSGNANYINKNQTGQLTATANMSTGSPQDVTATATWSSSAATIASVSASGLLTALNNGATTVSAAFGGQTGSLSVAVTLKAQPQITTQFFRLCSPFRARAEVTITEASGNAGMNVTGLTVTMKDFGGTTRYTHLFTPAELTTLLGSNHLNAGQSKVVFAESAYPGNVDTADSTATVSLTTTDDFGNTATTNFNVTFQRDGC